MPTVIGIDCSLTATALASAGAAGHRHYRIRTDASEPLTVRLRRLADECYRVVRDWPGGRPDLVVLETPGFIQRQGGMEGVYRAQGAILTGLPSWASVELVTVAQWRRDLGIHIGRGEGKAPVIAYVTALGIELPYNRVHTPDHDVADAYCLAEWGLRLLQTRMGASTVCAGVRGATQ